VALFFGAMATTKVGALKLRPAARYLGGLSMPTMYRLVQRKHLRPVRVLGIYLFPLTELNRFLESGLNTPPRRRRKQKKQHNKEQTHL
jgi:excisionase family DNA binding protein